MKRLFTRYRKIFVNQEAFIKTLEYFNIKELLKKLYNRKIFFGQRTLEITLEKYFLFSEFVQ